MGGLENQEDNLPNIELLDIVDTTVGSSDISVNSEWLPYSNNTILDNTQPEEDDDDEQPIQVITGNRFNGWNSDPLLPGGWISKDNNITVLRDNRLLLGSKMPTIFVANH